MFAICERGDAVIGHAGGSAPHRNIAALKPDAARAIPPGRGSEQKNGRQTQRDGNDGLGEIALVLILVERQSGPGLVTVHKADIGFETGVSR